MLKPNQKRIDRGMWWDRAWSLVEGCTPVSPACKNCWSAGATAMRVCQENQKIKERYGGLIVPRSKPATFNGTIRLIPGDLNKPTLRQKPAVWSVWNDLFHKDVPFHFRYKAFERMALCPQHFFIVCTKRPERIFKPDVKMPLKNVMVMTTAENQEQADKRIPHLLKSHFAYRGLSVEPMLGPVDLHFPLGANAGNQKFPDRLDLATEEERNEWFEGTARATYIARLSVVDWVIAGPETGPGARECKSEWIEDLYEQCKAAGVPFFDKRENYLAREFPK